MNPASTVKREGAKNSRSIHQTKTVLPVFKNDAIAPYHLKQLIKTLQQTLKNFEKGQVQFIMIRNYT